MAVRESRNEVDSEPRHASRGTLLGGGRLTRVLRSLPRPRRHYSVVLVQGNSMSPALRDGDRVLVRSNSRLETGRIVLFRSDPARRSPVVDTRGSEGLMIKRLAAVGGDPVPRQLRRVVAATEGDLVPAGELLVLGDHPCSEDSKLWGYVARDRVCGVVVRLLTRRSS